ncbi:MAG: PHP domain-containing protein [Pseudomonadota bacterium]|nr:PHP domain-containing protein [Pseudomonadota bacterium]
MSPIDLHSHSTASDGELAPGAVVAEAAAAGVKTLALTDHDTIFGLDAALQATRVHGMKLITGVEISVSLDRHTLHVLGLGIDPTAAALVDGLTELQRKRAVRASAIAAKLERLGVANALQRAEDMAAGGQITRSHFARLLIEAGIVKDTQRAFKRYLGQGRQAYVASQWAHLPDAIEWIHAAGGVAVLAHPFKYPLSRANRHRTLKTFRELGGDAMEVCCGTSSAEEISESARDALEFGLAGSIGSDYHGPKQPWAKLGRVAALPAAVTPINVYSQSLLAA